MNESGGISAHLSKFISSEFSKAESPSRSLLLSLKSLDEIIDSK